MVSRGRCLDKTDNLEVLLMEKSKCGQLTPKLVLQPTPRPRKPYGVSNGYRKSGDQKDLPRAEQAVAYRSIGRPPVAELAIKVLPLKV